MPHSLNRRVVGHPAQQQHAAQDDHRSDDLANNPDPFITVEGSQHAKQRNPDQGQSIDQQQHASQPVYLIHSAPPCLFTLEIHYIRMLFCKKVTNSKRLP